MFICGGAPVPEPLIRLYGGLGILFSQGYGLTETSPFVTIVPPADAATKIGSGRASPVLPHRPPRRRRHQDRLGRPASVLHRGTAGRRRGPRGDRARGARGGR